MDSGSVFVLALFFGVLLLALAAATWITVIVPLQVARLRVDRMRAEVEEIRFRARIHSVPAGDGNALLSPLPLQYAPPPPAYTPPPTPLGAEGEGETVSISVRDSAGRLKRVPHFPPRALRRYSIEQFQEIERLSRETDLTPSKIAEKVLGSKGGYQNAVVGFIQGTCDPPWIGRNGGEA